jgi:integrase
MRSLKLRRRDLGKTAKAQKEKARAIALDVIEGLANPSTESSSGDDEPAEVLTLGVLANLYERDGFHGVGASYAKAQVTKVRRFAEFLGPDRPVVSLCKSDIQRFAAHRAKDSVGLNTVAGELAAVKIMLNFGMEHRRLDGSPLLAANPLQRVRLAREEPQRPWCTPQRYEALKAVADRLPGAFPCILDLAWASGRRIGAILKLRWQDVSFESTREYPHGAVRWYAGHSQDKKKKDQVVPINTIAREALDRWREQCPGVGAAWLFTAPTDPSRALGHWIVVGWLRRAEELAQLEHLEHGGWHQFRRGWATVRKALSIKDVAAAGGWTKTETLVQCYQHSDPETILSVVNGGGGR